MKHKILFLAANPIGLTARKLDEEAHAIQEELQLASQRDQFEFVPRLAAQPMDLLRALRGVRPSIVHFVGHAQTDGIYLTADDGRPMQVTRDALHATVGAAGQSVQIVVLNGCATEDLAEAMCELVPVCVGTLAPISDEAARAFSVGFYGALASSESAARACLQGKAAMHLVVTNHHAPPLLRHRTDVDPETLVLATAGSAAAGAPHAPELTAVIERYRAHKRGSFERWDLRTAGPTTTTGNRPAEITLDEMYIPLRFAPELDPTKLDRGAPIEPDDLLEPRRPQVVIGGAGMGPDLGLCFGRDLGLVFERDLGRYYGQYFGRDFGLDYFGRDLRRVLGLDLSSGFSRDFDRDFGRYFGRYFERYFGPDFGREYIHRVLHFARFLASPRPARSAMVTDLCGPRGQLDGRTRRAPGRAGLRAYRRRSALARAVPRGVPVVVRTRRRELARRGRSILRHLRW